MKHVFKYLDFAEDREHAESVATKELKLDHVEKFAIRDLAMISKSVGVLSLSSLVDSMSWFRSHEAGGDGIEPLNCGIESRRWQLLPCFASCVNQTFNARNGSRNHKNC